jgi:hypothetical protein
MKLSLFFRVKIANVLENIDPHVRLLLRHNFYLLLKIKCPPQIIFLKYSFSFIVEKVKPLTIILWEHQEILLKLGERIRVKTFNGISKNTLISVKIINGDLTICLFNYIFLQMINPEVSVVKILLLIALSLRSLVYTGIPYYQGVGAVFVV